MARAVLSIGNFDGVHIGHAALIARAREVAPRHDARVVVLAFDPHPAVVLRPGEVAARLTTFDDRRRLLLSAGTDEVVRLVPTPELLALSAPEFIAGLVARYSPAAFVEGADFRFGRGRAGDLAVLSELGRGHGFEVVAVPPVEAVLSDHTVAPASSTLARWLLGHGRVSDAAAVLGRPYEIEGEVMAGDRRGRAIGYPTANLRVECLVPGDGVYAGIGVLPDGRALPAAVSIGTKPTFGERVRAVEAFLLIDEPECGRSDARAWRPIDGLPEYGWRLRLRFSAWLRDQMRFESLDLLLQQMTRDCGRVRLIAASGGAESVEGRETVASQ